MEEEWRGGRLRQKDARSEKLNWFGRPPWISSWKVTCIPILNSRLRRLHSLFNLFRLASIFDSNASLASNSIPPIVFNIHLLRMACWLSSVCDDRQEPEQVALRWEGSGPCLSQRLQFQGMIGASMRSIDRVHGWYFDSWGESIE